MRLTPFAAVLPMLIAGTTLPAQNPATRSKPLSADTRQLLRLEDQWAAALVKRDASFFRRTLHPDYVYSDERGTFTKAQVIAEQVGGTDSVTYAANEGMQAHVHAPAGVVTGTLIVRGRGANGAFEHRYRYTDTWIRQRGTWVMIASQDYDMPRSK